MFIQERGITYNLASAFRIDELIKEDGTRGKGFYWVGARNGVFMQEFWETDPRYVQIVAWLSRNIIR